MMRCAEGATGSPPTGAYFTKFVPGRRGEILDAALCVFADKGYEGGTMREIATVLGVTEPALYRHYAGKEALFEDLVAVAGDQVVKQAAIMLDAFEPETLRESLRELIRTRRDHAHGNDSVKPILQTLFTAAPHNAAFREVFRTHLGRPMLTRLTAFVPRVDEFYGIARSPERLASSLRAFLSLFVGYFMTGMMLDLPDDDEGIVMAMMAIMGWDAPAA